MTDNTGIEWTDATWNPTVGCSVLSPGCTNCYAMKMAGRLEAMGQPIYRGLTIKTKAGYVWSGKVGASNHGQMIKPLSWRKPRRIFVNSMSDLFHEDMPDEVIDQVFAVMALCPQHTFQVLTKRAERMREWFTSSPNPKELPDRRAALNEMFRTEHWANNMGGQSISLNRWPLPNVWLGVSVEDQPRADERIPHLLATPAAVRFLSCEPLLSDIELRWALGSPIEVAAGFLRRGQFSPGMETLRAIDWVIAGGESGPGKRPMDLAWMRSIRDQCEVAGVPFFGKQWDKVRELPADLRVREWPEVVNA